MNGSRDRRRKTEPQLCNLRFTSRGGTEIAPLSLAWEDATGDLHYHVWLLPDTFTMQDRTLHVNVYRNVPVQKDGALVHRVQWVTHKALDADAKVHRPMISAVLAAVADGSLYRKFCQEEDAKEAEQKQVERINERNERIHDAAHTTLGLLREAYRALPTTGLGETIRGLIYAHLESLKTMQEGE